jgi:hypothetical protein
MSATSPEFAKMIPGFDFLQGLVKNAGSVLPGMGQWVAPTLDPAELEKRIEELRTIQFWLEQNARMLAATIQALEVQRMTLSTLKTMNVQMADLHESMRIKRPEDVAPHRPAPARPETPAAAAAAAAPAPAPAPAPKTVESSQASNAPAAAGPSAASLVDPMQWWGALTKQFTELATTAMKDVAPGASTQLADQLVKQSIRAAEQTFKAGLPAAKKPVRKSGAKAATSIRASATGDQPARKTKAAAPAKRPAPRRR